MIWILDGYNVIHAISSLERKLDVNLQAARDALIFMCKNLQNSRGDFQKIYVVFDGSSAFRDLPPYKTASLEVIFTETKEDADDRIIELLETRFSNKRVGVISNDNYVMNHARVFGAERMSAQEFEKFCLPTQNPQKISSKNISKTLQKNITDEYKQHLGLD